MHLWMMSADAARRSKEAAGLHQDQLGGAFRREGLPHLHFQYRAEV